MSGNDQIRNILDFLDCFGGKIHRIVKSLLCLEEVLCHDGVPCHYQTTLTKEGSCFFTGTDDGDRRVSQKLLDII